MLGKAHMITRIATAIGLAASVATWVAQPALGFDGRSPDTRAAALQAQPGSAIDVRSPDTREAAQDVERYGARDGWYEYAVSLTRSSDTATVDARSPDTRDAAVPARTLVRAVSPDHFNWGDFGIGVGAAVGLLLLLATLGAGALASRQKREENTSPATT